jgi:hypothetical protein
MCICLSTRVHVSREVHKFSASPSIYLSIYIHIHLSFDTHTCTHLAVVLLLASFRFAITHTHTHTKAVGQMVPSFREKVGGDPFIAVVAYKGSPPPGWMMQVCVCVCVCLSLFIAVVTCKGSPPPGWMMQVCWVGGVGGWVGRSVTTFV